MPLHMRLMWILERICTVLFVFMTVLIFVQVVLRYVFSLSLFWAEEAARWSMIWIVFLGCVVATHQAAHTRVSYFVELLPGLPKRIVEGSVALVCAVSCFLIAWYGIPVFRVSISAIAPGLGITKGVEYIAVPLCCTAMGVIFFVQGIRVFLGYSADLRGDINEQKTEGGAA
ncbi:MAG: TRAP transporter small permease [Methylobacteriaceae bacterium]|jgi:TRAP-type C4-dicarboxylate transport system permease small subunit|nr:TRAP transporter small permease [Methylobacteriaceae bacterium]